MEMWIIISSIATVTIAFWGGCSFWLAYKIKTKNDDFRQQVTELYMAIVYSNFLSGPDRPTSAALENKIKQFMEWYKGETDFFNADDIWAGRKKTPKVIAY